MAAAWTGIVSTMGGYVGGFLTATAPITVAIIGLFAFGLVISIVIGITRNRKG